MDGETILGADAHVITALRADILRGLEIAMEDHVPAGRAFLPEIFGRLGAAACHEALDARPDEIGDPIHGVYSTTGCAAGRMH